MAKQQRSNNNTLTQIGWNNGQPVYQQTSGNGNSQGVKKKRSGAKHTRYTPKEGPNKGENQYLTTGWKSTKQGLIAVKCVTTKDSKLSDKGWMGSIACTLTNQSTGQQEFYYGTMHQSTGKVVINGINWVVNPKAPNGGYCGNFLGKK